MCARTHTTIERKVKWGKGEKGDHYYPLEPSGKKSGSAGLLSISKKKSLLMSFPFTLPLFVRVCVCVFLTHMVRYSRLIFILFFDFNAAKNREKGHLKNESNK